jgi:hypothetical protein
MLSVVTWIWDDGSQRAQMFQPEHVNTLQRMIARNLPVPHRFICVADRPEGFSDAVEVFKTPPEAVKVGELRTPEAQHFPSCYRRLWMFSPDAVALGERVLLIDIDLVAVSDLSPLFDRDEDFVGWRPRQSWGTNKRFGGGLYLLRTGARTNVWTDFKGPKSICEARTAGFRGSDQAWISYKLSDSEVCYPNELGIYSIRDMKDGKCALPSDALLVQFNGRVKPWQSPLPWVKEHWR